MSCHICQIKCDTNADKATLYDICALCYHSEMAHLTPGQRWVPLLSGQRWVPLLVLDRFGSNRIKGANSV